MTQTRLVQEVRKMHFLDVLNIWTEGRLVQEDAARMLGICDRTFRRYRSLSAAQHTAHLCLAIHVNPGHSRPRKSCSAWESFRELT